MITYTWTIENVIVTPSVTIGSDTFTDVVNKIKWRCSGTEGSNTAYEEQTWAVTFDVYTWNETDQAWDLNEDYETENPFANNPLYEWNETNQQWDEIT